MEDKDLATKEFFDKYKTPKSNVPIDLKFDEKQIPFFNQNIEFEPQRLNYESKPGHFESFKNSWISGLELHSLYDYIDNSNYKNPFHDPVPEGWNPSKSPEQFEGIDEKLHGFMLQATSPLDLRNRKFLALDKMEEERRVKNGTMLGQITAGFADLPFNLTTYIPLGTFAKYATLSHTFLNNVPKAAVASGIWAASHNAWQETFKMGGNLEEFVHDTLLDTISGTAFMGAGLGLGHGMRAAKLFESNQVLKHNWNGVEIKPVVNSDASISGFKAVPMEGFNVSAAQVDAAQKFADSQFAQKGLFYIPYLGKWIGKGANAINPTMRMLNSRFPTVSGFINRVANHPFITKGVEEGRERPITFEEKMQDLAGSNRQYKYILDGLHMEMNGIDTSNRAIGTLQFQKRKWEENFVSREEFHNKIINSIIKNEQSEFAPVNKGAALVRSLTDEMYLRYKKAYGLPEQILTPKTALGYLMRVYDTGALELRQKDWVNMWVDHLTNEDSTINSFLRPIENQSSAIKAIETEHKKLIESKTASDAEIRESVNHIKEMKQQLKKMQDNMQNELRENEAFRGMIFDANALSAKEALKLKKLTKNLRKIKKEYKTKRAYQDKLNHHVFILESKLKEAKNKNKIQEIRKELEPLKAEQQKVNEEIEKLKDKRFLEEDKLQEKAQNGEIDPILFTPIKGSNKVAFKKASNRLKFRSTFESQFHMEQAALGYRDTILNQTAEDSISQIMGGLMGSSSQNPTLQRTLMIADEVLYNNGFLSKDLIANVANYRNALGRRTFLKESFQDVTIDGGIDEIIARLQQEKNLQEAKINKEFEGKKRDKELSKLNKDFNKAKKDMQMSYEKMMGRTKGNDSIREFSLITRAFAASTKLGAVPLTMITDMAAIVFKHGFWPTIRDGLIPMLRTINGKLNTKEAELYTQNAAHAHLAYEHVCMGYADKHYGGIAQPYEPLGGKISNGMQTIAHYSNNWFMTNYFENVLQRWSANVIQSKIMKYMKDYQAGNLKKVDLDKLLVYGIHPEKWANRFVDGWKSRGSDGNGLGGYQSRFWEWNDVEAANMFSQVVNKATRDTIIRRGSFDAPFFFDDPIVAMAFPFKGYLFASVSHYLIPAMQRPDLEKLVGIVSMLSMGALVSPLRHISKGENPIADDENMFMNAFRDSSVFSLFTDIIDTANLISGGRLLPGAINDKQRNLTRAGALGPISQTAFDAGTVISDIITNNFNKTDVKKMGHMVPSLESWFLRGLINAGIEGSSLPENYKQAQAQHY